MTPEFIFLAGNSVLRYIVARLKPILLPNANRFGAVIRIDVKNHGIIKSALIDKDGASTYPLTSAVQKHSRLFLGSLRNLFVGYIDLPADVNN